jgi:hypothetical protein
MNSGVYYETADVDVKSRQYQGNEEKRSVIGSSVFVAFARFQV